MADEIKVGQSAVRLVKGDITLLEVDAFVFYARPDLQLGSGFGTAITLRGGPPVQEDLKKAATPVAATQAVITTAGNLPAKHIIHVVGPRFQEEDTEAKLRASVVSAMRLADQHDLKRVALPAMGAGFYGVPLDMCARVMLETIRAYLAGPTGIEEALVCVLDSREMKPFEAKLADMVKKAGASAEPQANRQAHAAAGIGT